MLVGVVGDDRKTMRKFLRVGVPVANAAKPAGIDVKHIHAQLGGIANHAQRDGFVHVHAAAPTVVGHLRIVWIFPGLGIAQRCAHPSTQNVSCSVRAVAETA